MKQLSAKDRKKAMDVLAECATATKGITDKEELHKAASEIFGKAFSGKPEMMKRACQAYNSAKSIYMLSSANDDTRGNDYALLDPEKMYKEAKDMSVTESLRKAASAVGLAPVKFTSNPGKALAKVASATQKKEAPAHPQVDSIDLTDTQVKGAIKEHLDGFEGCILKYASAGNKLAREFEAAKSVFIRKMASESSDSRKRAAEILCAHFGDVGSALVDEFNVAEPLKKIAHYNKNKYKGSVALPNTDLYKTASGLVKANENLKEHTDKTMLLIDMTLDYVRDVSRSGRMSKSAAALTPVSLLGTQIGTEMLKGTPELLDLDDPDETQLRKAIYTTEFKNRLKEHALRRAFMDMLLDPSVQKYPLDKILNAYNMSLKEVPLNLRDLPSTANLGLLKSRTLALLGRGGVPSAGDADTIMNIQKTFGRIDPETFITKADKEEA
jgi:hypothetical protein